MTGETGKTRIAVLGGGVGAMTAAFEITESPGWQDKYEITVYQMGWRLGGKGASGRNVQPKMGHRIEEHGLHLWFGYYENAFNAMRRCYEALGRDPSEPLSTCIEGANPAFKPHELFVICQFWESKWSQWDLMPPVIGHELPGDGKVPPFWEVLDRLLAFMHRHYLDQLPEPVRLLMESHSLADRVKDFLSRHGIVHAKSKGGAGELEAARKAVQKIGTVHSMDDALKKELLDAVDAIGHFLERLTGALESNFAEKIENLFGVEPTVHRWLSLIDLGFYMFKGIVIDDCFEKGFEQLDHLDLREWLAGHGAGEIALNADALRVAYESIFAYEQGSYELPNLAAGTGLGGLLRLCFTFKGGFAWKMQAGMGDTVFGPYYEVLKARGVKFRFFSKVTEIVPAEDGRTIEAIRYDRQVDIKGGPENYDPLFDVAGLPCWPSFPLCDQLVQGDLLQQTQDNLESNWSEWKNVETGLVLERGKDFDQVICGISLGGLRDLTPKIIDQKPAWSAMLDKVKTVQTQAFQIWTHPDTAAMRKPPRGEAPKLKEAPVYGGFAQPHNTCADMSHLLPRETWGKDSPQGIYYFCGPMVEPSLVPLSTAYGYPGEAAAAVKVRAMQWLRTNGQFLFPGAVSRGYPGGFPDTWDFEILYQPSDIVPLESQVFDGQFWRANIDPSERYVLSMKGTMQYRIKADDCGYDNMVLAGDWTYTALNYGCVEAATMSGMEASRKICGYPKIIFGENFPKE